jgi:hypothetical protein
MQNVKPNRVVFNYSARDTTAMYGYKYDWNLGRVSDNRENEMLRNIYTYSKENNYNQAVFLIGSAHRNSIIRKVAEYDTKEKVELNWTFYSKT